MNIILQDYESLRLNTWPKINVGRVDLYFMVQWFCLISWSLLDIWTPLFRIMSQYDPMFDLKINVGHCDLYFMVQRFCLISWSDFSSFIFCSEKHFSFIGKAQFRRATLSCDSCYWVVKWLKYLEYGTAFEYYWLNGDLLGCKFNKMRKNMLFSPFLTTSNIWLV